VVRGGASGGGWIVVVGGGSISILWAPASFSRAFKCFLFVVKHDCHYIICVCVCVLSLVVAPYADRGDVIIAP